MAKTVADVMKMVKENEVKFVDFRFTDTRGKEQHVTVPVSHFDDDKFTSAQSFTTTETGSDSYANPPGVYKVRYKSVTGTELATLLAANSSKTACWRFQFTSGAGATTQPTLTYCR